MVPINLLLNSTARYYFAYNLSYFNLILSLFSQFYSNKDLSKFLALSGLPNASIPSANVYGDLPNDQSDPGGEAQLDVEYIMVSDLQTFFSVNLI
jgi:hypothetical protein